MVRPLQHAMGCGRSKTLDDLRRAGEIDPSTGMQQVLPHVVVMLDDRGRSEVVPLRGQVCVPNDGHVEVQAQRCAHRGVDTEVRRRPGDEKVLHAGKMSWLLPGPEEPRRFS